MNGCHFFLHFYYKPEEECNIDVTSIAISKHNNNCTSAQRKVIEAFQKSNEYVRHIVAMTMRLGYCFHQIDLEYADAVFKHDLFGISLVFF